MVAYTGDDFTMPSMPYMQFDVYVDSGTVTFGSDWLMGYLPPAKEWSYAAQVNYRKLLCT